MKSKDILDEDITDLPDWMKGVDQESLKKEVEEEINSIPVIVGEVSDISSYDDIPDWLKNTPIAPGEVVHESKKDIQESPKIEPTEEVIVELKQKQHLPLKKKQPKTPTLPEK